MQRLGLLHLRQRAHLCKDCLRKVAVDLDQRYRVATWRVAPDVEGGDVDAGLAEGRGKLPDETRLVEIGNVDHRRPELGIHPDSLDVDDARTAVGKDGARDV